ncbi:hypothetical protein [Clostridium sp. JN-9]|uniref:hypothetical protein n=1 Tax=Clostridium sp. JN-9 TaxID=2507159 RepID=UPI000FFDFCA3|nr:hypothetical protein [Clostridium sp. JN-9]QAT40844.1 hypothetical protein EQM05_11540 [Clostridium sp. JN-9]
MITNPEEIFYFKKNLDWYKIIEDEEDDDIDYILTDKATKEAKESFAKYRAIRDREKREGSHII